MPLEVSRTDPFADAEIVTSLLSRQDEVIAELDLLDAQVMSVIEEVTAQRESSEEEAITLSLEADTENSQDDSSGDLQNDSPDESTTHPNSGDISSDDGIQFKKAA